MDYTRQNSNVKPPDFIFFLDFSASLCAASTYAFCEKWENDLDSLEEDTEMPRFFRMNLIGGVIFLEKNFFQGCYYSS